MDILDLLVEFKKIPLLLFLIFFLLFFCEAQAKGKVGGRQGMVTKRSLKVTKKS